MAKGNGGTRGASSSKGGNIVFPSYAFSSLGSEPSQIGGPDLYRILAEQFGDSQESIQEARKLLNRHTEGGAGQDAADNRLYELINDKDSEVGKTLRDMAAVNAEHYKRQMAMNKANLESNVEKDFPMERMFTSSDISDSEVRQSIRQRYAENTEMRVYRGGGRKNTEAWTTNPLGADVGSGIRIPVDHSSTVGQMLKTHYMVAGITQGIGSPGENEILFIKKKR